MGASRDVRSVEQAREVLVGLGAPERLITHGLLVSEAATQLLARMSELGVAVDDGLVLAGAVLHDAGKTVHWAELDAPGAAHEEAGQHVLLEHGVDPVLARCCVSHAGWRTMECSLEELLVALADALWKGVRRGELEAVVVDRVAAVTGADRWSLLIELDTCFEAIADEGPLRLARSRL